MTCYALRSCCRHWADRVERYVPLVELASWRAAAPQRVLPLATVCRTHATWHRAVVRLGGRRRPECLLSEVLQSSGSHMQDGAAPVTASQLRDLTVPTRCCRSPGRRGRQQSAQSGLPLIRFQLKPIHPARPSLGGGHLDPIQEAMRGAAHVPLWERCRLGGGRLCCGPPSLCGGRSSWNVPLAAEGQRGRVFQNKLDRRNDVYHSQPRTKNQGNGLSRVSPGESGHFKK